MYFQEIIKILQEYWSENGCSILLPYDVEVGAGTLHPATVFNSLGDEEFACCYVQPSRRPKDGRFAENPNRVQRHHQFQVIFKPPLDNIQDLYLKSLELIGLSQNEHDIRFVEDDWESPILGASGLGWEVWCDGMEVTQFTYFQQMGGIPCEKVTVEIAYGLERIVMYVQNVSNLYDICWDKNIKYKNLFHRSEYEFSNYNFYYSNVDNIKQQIDFLEQECINLNENKLSLPAYDLCLKMSHLFNLLDASGIISPMQRSSLILRVRKLVAICCTTYLSRRGMK